MPVLSNVSGFAEVVVAFLPRTAPAPSPTALPRQGSSLHSRTTNLKTTSSAGCPLNPGIVMPISADAIALARTHTRRRRRRRQTFHNYQNDRNLLPKMDETAEFVWMKLRLYDEVDSAKLLDGTPDAPWEDVVRTTMMSRR